MLQRLLIATLLMLVVPGHLISAEQTRSAPSSTSQQRALGNSDVIEMLKAGLSADVVLEKLRYSAVSFDTSTQGLVALKAAGVPDQIIKAMISRPIGAPASDPAIEGHSVANDLTIVTTLEQVKSVVVLVQPSSDVLRGIVERLITDLGGPRVASPEASHEASLLVNVECGSETFSRLTMSIYVPCTGAFEAESGTNRLWGTTGKERESSEAEATRNVVQKMTKTFVAAWRRAHGMEPK